jgi:hypothetical protein
MNNMMGNPMMRQRSFLLVMMAMVLIAVVSLVGLHGAGPIHSKTIHNQGGVISCSITICAAILAVGLLLALFLMSSIVWNFIHTFQTEPVFIIERPPRR